MTFGRLLLYLALLVGIAFQLFLSGEWENETYGYGFTGAILLLAAFLVLTSGKKKPKRRPARKTRQVEEEPEESFDLPEAVTETEDGGSRRDRKIAHSNETDSESSEHSEDDDISIEEDEIEEVEEVHVAEEYVVDVDPEMAEEEDIEEALAGRRKSRQEIKRRIEERRRGQLADIRASAARMWSKQDESEDLLAIVSKPGHGLTILDEPVEVAPGHPYGATYVRLDSARIMKVRVALDGGFVAAQEHEEEVEVEVDDLPPPPDGLPLPPSPEDLPPPPTSSQSKLDALREEMG